MDYSAVNTIWVLVGAALVFFMGTFREHVPRSSPL